MAIKWPLIDYPAHHKQACCPQKVRFKFRFFRPTCPLCPSAICSRQLREGTFVVHFVMGGHLPLDLFQLTRLPACVHRFTVICLLFAGEQQYPASWSWSTWICWNRVQACLQWACRHSSSTRSLASLAVLSFRVALAGEVMPSSCGPPT